jgi:hypothetical protein
MSSNSADVAVITGLIGGGIVLFALAIVLAGFFIWWLWPIAVPAFFPGLVASGTLAAEVSFWQSVALSWLCGALFGKVKYNKGNSNE